MIEIEAKMKIDDPAPLAALLQSRHARCLGDFLETNTFFDTQNRDLLAADRGVRLRVSRNVATGQATCVLTHKGPNRRGPFKSREETELGVADARQAQRLLECLGYVRTLSFQKRRQSWTLDDCRVELDEVPYVGRFVEIEGPSESAVMRMRSELGLADRPLIKASYVAMVSAYLQERGDRRTQIVFGQTSA
jgi:predicted adenylyl cyclase CyaB